MKKIVIVGATSGIGLEVAKEYIKAGWKVGVAGRRKELLDQVVSLAPDRVWGEQIDVTAEEAPARLRRLTDRMGGMDVFLLSSGVGKQNPELHPETELQTAETNVCGFIRMVLAAFHYFEACGGGHIAVISSIAGTKGLGIASAYSATKRFQNTYIDCLEQLARMKKLSIMFTDIRPGFVATPLLKDDSYPFLMPVTKVAHCIFYALNSRKRVVVIDWRYRILVFFWRLIPRWLWVRLPIKN